MSIFIRVGVTANMAIMARNAFLAACMGVASLASAQGYPAKPVHLVVPFPAGGVVDTTARLLQPKLSEGLGQPVIIDNRPGAGGNIAADFVAKSAADGYTLLITTHGHAISAGLYRKLPYDTARDFAPVTQIASSFLVLVANPGVPARSVKELLALARARPGKLNYGSTGLGAPPHLVGELFKQTTGIDVVHVPYKGDAPMYQALLSGEVDFAFGPLGNAIQHIRSGKLRALGMTNPRRSPAIPDVPTMVEAGVPGFELTGWLGLFAPAGTPRPAVDRLYEDMAKAIAQARERFPALGYEPVGSTPDEFAARFKSDITLYARIIRDAKIPLQD
ncbi:MAG TPA: tripartite tricarboxylate transporter substrate binding protein [Burkholderiales bacterium]|nr:tripartite tricarboxylate transporter substrate binding protein [Burkholderiales bacterium]